MNRLAPLAILLALAGLSRPARAGDAGPRLGNPQPAVALGVGFTSSIQNVGGVDLSGAGIHFEALARVFPETLGGIEVDALLVGSAQGPSNPARTLRAGAKLRQSVFGWGDLGLGGELALVLGIGWEQIEWNAGGQLGRTQFVIGIEDCLVANRRVGNRQRYGSLAFGARGVFSRGTVDGPAADWSGAVMFDVILRGSP